MSNELTVVDLAPVSPETLQQQVNAIQKAMGQVMKEGVHYGKVPGCGDKPALLKPGAEKVGMMFRLMPRFEIKEKNFPNGHREYELVCTLLDHRGNFAGQGVGICSTMEAKYRYRGNALELTETPVPKDYWNGRSLELLAKAMGGEFEPKQLAAKKNEGGQWVIAIKGEKQENPDIADTYNTVLKMAKKRAHVDAVLTATAASDIFTQDVDEMLDDAIETTAVKVEPAKKPEVIPADQIKQPPRGKIKQQALSSNGPPPQAPLPEDDIPW